MMKITKLLIILILALGLIVWLVPKVEAGPMGTAWTYQGRLMDDNQPADGVYDIAFVLFDAPEGPNEIYAAGVEDFDIVDGYFTVELDFGSRVFDGNRRWLEAAVRPYDSNDPNAYVILSPRIELTPAPYALYAKTAGGDNDWTISGDNMHSAVLGNVGIGTPVPTSKLEVTGFSPAPIILGYNSGTGAGIRGENAGFGHGVYGKSISGFAGYFEGHGHFSDNVGIGTDSPAARLEVNGAILRTGSTMHGADAFTHINLGANSTTGQLGYVMAYATIGGGQDNTASGNWATVSGGYLNDANNQSATVGGGSGNLANGDHAVVSGGWQNIASGVWATVGGGYWNDANGTEATIGGGSRNTASGDDATVGGGYFNDASGSYDTVGGGQANTANGGSATVAGGQANTASGDGATVSGGYYNDANGESATVGGGTANNANAMEATIGGGQYNTVSDSFATVGGGRYNTARRAYAIVGGGMGNNANGISATIGGGYLNAASSDSATVGGGERNAASGYYATVPGGLLNAASGGYSFAAGHRAKANHLGTFVWADSTDANFASTSNNQFLIRASGGVGIGTTDPQQRLDINGHVRIRAFYTATAADVHVQPNGDLVKVTSSERYKKDIRDLEVGSEGVCDLRPVRFKWKESGEEDIGLIAEEVNEVIKELVVCDQEGRPDAVKYDRIALYLLAVVKAQQQKIATLEETVAQDEMLKQRLEALERAVQQQRVAEVK
jgi:hypothetical protein